MADDSDEILVAKAKAGSKEAFGKLASRYYDMVYGLAYGILNRREPALDVAQDVFLKVYNDLDKYEGRSKFKTWLYRVSVNAAIDHQRRIRYADSIDSTDTSDDDDKAPLIIVDPKQDPLESAAQSEMRVQIEKALNQLTPDQRMILTLREWQGLSYEEIAETLQIEAGTVMSRLFYARKRLAEVLGVQYGAEVLKSSGVKYSSAESRRSH